MNELRVLLVMGTRPEAIKMAPIIEQLRLRQDSIRPIVCTSGQHQDLLAPVLDYFGIAVDEHLHVMQPDQSLGGLAARCIEGMDALLSRRSVDCVVVQGDTSTAMAGALAAFYRRVPVVHVEAGLRTASVAAPWPEELHRRLISSLASVHCSPTERAKQALLKEGIPDALVHVTGNTVIDALRATLARENGRNEVWNEKYAMLGDRRLVLVTAHRRESFGAGLENVCRAIRALATRFPQCHFLYPVHLNPHVREPVYRMLTGIANIHLVSPLLYPEFVWLMSRSTLILTDSGGVQEEAPTLRKPVVVMRETTEREEAVEAGAAKLAGTSCERIVNITTRLLTDPIEYAASQVEVNPYGDGHAADRIVRLVLEQFSTGSGQAAQKTAFPGDPQG